MARSAGPASTPAGAAKSGNGTVDTGRVALRKVRPDDLPTFFAHQLDPEANRTAAFTVADSAESDAFAARGGDTDELVLELAAAASGEAP